MSELLGFVALVASRTGREFAAFEAPIVGIVRAPGPARHASMRERIVELLMREACIREIEEVVRGGLPQLHLSDEEALPPAQELGVLSTRRMRREELEGADAPEAIQWHPLRLPWRHAAVDVVAAPIVYLVVGVDVDSIDVILRAQWGGEPQPS